MKKLITVMDFMNDPNKCSRTFEGYVVDQALCKKSFSVELTDDLKSYMNAQKVLRDVKHSIDAEKNQIHFN